MPAERAPVAVEVAGLTTSFDEVRVLDDFSSGREQNLEACADRITILRGSITERALVDEAVRGCDYVLHEAALPSVPRSIADPAASDQINVHGTLTVLLAARDAGVRRVVYASSSSVYGETPVLPKVESLPTDPRSPYAVAKLAGEHYARVFAGCYGLETVALRYFNVFGPRQRPDSQYAAVLPRFITAALTGQRPTIFGDGGQTRDFCFIDNVVAANLQACVAEGVSGAAFNIACGARTSLLEVIAALREITGASVEPRFEPARAGDIRDSLADITAARTGLGYEAAVSFADGLRRTVRWYEGQLLAGR